MIEPLLRFLIAIGSVFVSVIPRRYRLWWPIQSDADLRGPAIVSAVLEILVGAPGTTLYFAVGLTGAKLGYGIAGLILNPYVPYVYMFVEGIFRLLAALGTSQILPILPLQIIAWIHDAKNRNFRVRDLGKLQIDEVEKGDGSSFDLRVLSCRPKAHWNAYMTIRFNDEFYQLLREETLTGPRKFAYQLRRSPSSRLVVVVYEYKPDDVLNSSLPPRRWRP